MKGNPVATFLTKAVEDGLFPGAAFTWGDRERAESGVVGRTGYGEGWPLVNERTRYDLASLTKVIATTHVAHGLWKEGQLKLEAKVIDLTPGFRHPDVTVEHLLRHESGLPAYAHLEGRGLTRQEVLDALFALNLEQAPGEQTVYSCVGFIMLQKVLENLTGDSLRTLADDRVFHPLGMDETTFGPVGSAAPTGRVEPWHGLGRGWLEGRVHDPLAFLLGGVSGNAGLFGTATDLAKYCQALLRAEELWGQWTARSSGHERALGWDLKSESGSSSGESMSADSFGHTGFTGTSVWIDPRAGRFAVLLTNAVHPLGSKTDLRSTRSKYADVALANLIS